MTTNHRRRVARRPVTDPAATATTAPGAAAPSARTAAGVFLALAALAGAAATSNSAVGGGVAGGAGAGTGTGATAVERSADEGDVELRSRTLFDFSESASASVGPREAWTAVNDGVMGGVSNGLSRLSSEGTLEFIGNVSLDNNGGFASIRSRTDEFNLADFDGLAIRVRGDGNTYTFGLTTNVFIPAGGFEVKFDSRDDGSWQEFYFPFEAFQATTFGNRVRNAPPPDPSEIRRFSLLIADKQVGPFRLELAEVRAVKRGPAPDRAAIAPPSIDDVDAGLRSTGGREGTSEREAADAAATRDGQRAAAQSIITLAIERGVPLFNEGNPAACAAVYEVAIEAVLALTTDAFGRGVRDEIARTLANGRAERDVTRRAWIFRIALDRALIETLPRSGSSSDGVTGPRQQPRLRTGGGSDA